MIPTYLPFAIEFGAAAVDRGAAVELARSRRLVRLAAHHRADDVRSRLRSARARYAALTRILADCVDVPRPSPGYVARTRRQIRASQDEITSLKRDLAEAQKRAAVGA